MPAGCGAQPDARLVGVGTGGAGKLGSPNCRQAACVAARTQAASYGVRAEWVGSARLGAARPAAAAPTATVNSARRVVGRCRATTFGLSARGSTDRPGGWVGLGAFLPDLGVLHQPGVQGLSDPPQAEDAFLRLRRAEPRRDRPGLPGGEAFAAQQVRAGMVFVEPARRTLQRVA